MESVELSRLLHDIFEAKMERQTSFTITKKKFSCRKYEVDQEGQGITLFETEIYRKPISSACQGKSMELL